MHPINHIKRHMTDEPVYKSPCLAASATLDHLPADSRFAPANESFHFASLLICCRSPSLGQHEFIA